ncbi:hypothetical protein [Streptomyces sp. NBC_01296]|uniref:hypothetical protein n=1 Tax=Streptomyces sp. NBC_01296 TaxID=2903816 RepID=UPI002E144FB1|nr:hypothetical protein OG299_40225 [Streptomyces sp. NBC_01296]
MEFVGTGELGEVEAVVLAVCWADRDVLASSCAGLERGQDVLRMVRQDSGVEAGGRTEVEGAPDRPRSSPNRPPTKAASTRAASQTYSRTPGQRH